MSRVLETPSDLCAFCIKIRLGTYLNYNTRHSVYFWIISAIDQEKSEVVVGISRCRRRITTLFMKPVGSERRWTTGARQEAAGHPTRTGSRTSSNAFVRRSSQAPLPARLIPTLRPHSYRASVVSCTLASWAFIMWVTYFIFASFVLNIATQQEITFSSGANVLLICKFKS